MTSVNSDISTPPMKKLQEPEQHRASEDQRTTRSAV
jgi:hypothetical protein